MFEPELLNRILEISVALAGVFLGAAMVLVAGRLALGPTVADRALALDLLGFIAVALAAVVVLRTQETVLFDPAMALALVAFLATIGLAHFHAKEAPSDRVAGRADMGAEDQEDHRGDRDLTQTEGGSGG